MDDMITDLVARLFRDHRGRPGAAVPFDPQLWAAVAEMGLPLALVPEDAGGFGLDPVAATAILTVAAEQAIGLPLGETMLANLLLTSAGLAPAAGPLAVVALAGADCPAGTVLPRVPHGRDLAGVVAVGADWLALVSGPFTHQPGTNLAGEPRDNLTTTCAPEQRGVHRLDAAVLAALPAVLTAAQMAGAARAVLALAVDYANTRVQFGRPIGKQQAIQHHLAVIASEVAATTAGAEMAAGAIAARGSDPAGFVRLAAAAKIRAGEAAGRIAALAHQVHGAIGFTREYELQLFTRRLWAWRDENGSEAVWAEILGRELCAGGADALWPTLTRPIGAVA